jgi:hypothetical protein
LILLVKWFGIKDALYINQEITTNQTTKEIIMKCLTQQKDNSFLYHYTNGIKEKGKHLNLQGDCSNLKGDCTGLRGDYSNLRGDCSNLRGDCSYLRGDCSNLRGDCSDLSGDCTGLQGDLDEITMNERAQTPNIQDYIK